MNFCLALGVEGDKVRPYDVICACALGLCSRSRQGRYVGGPLVSAKPVGRACGTGRAVPVQAAMSHPLNRSQTVTCTTPWPCLQRYVLRPAPPAAQRGGTFPGPCSLTSGCVVDRPLFAREQRRSQACAGPRRTWVRAWAGGHKKPDASEPDVDRRHQYRAVRNGTCLSPAGRRPAPDPGSMSRPFSARSRRGAGANTKPWLHMRDR